MSSRLRASLVALALWLLCPSPALATWTEVSHVSLGATGAITSVGPTSAISTTTANAIVCSVAYYNGITDAGNSNLADSASNSWTASTNQIASGDGSLKVITYRVIAPTTSGSHTFTFTGPAATTSASIVCFALTQGSSPTYVTMVSSNSTSGTGPTTIQAGSIGNANDLVVTGVSFYTANTQSIDSSFATPIEVGYSAANHLGLAASWKQVSGAVNPQWSVSGNNSGTEAAQSISLTGTAGGGATCNGGLLLLGVGGCH